MNFLQQKPLIIAGPCSAESEEQVLNTAMQLKSLGNVNAFRAGIWKPRTRPGHFEGVGVIGLPWLQKAKAITGLPIAIEVANALQVEQALKHEIDILWIGARTTVNPFSVQEVADALKGVNIPVMIKNPVNPDIDLWAGAVERIVHAGVKDIALIHRGFSHYGKSNYRNLPMWQLAIEMKRSFAHLPFIIDPSHISGNRNLLKEVTQNALDLDYDGLMIESHQQPDDAWSDAAQQIKPEDLKKLLEEIIWRKESVENSFVHLQLEQLRRQIDQLDDEILERFKYRMLISEQIGAYKREHGITILQTERWNQILERVLKVGESSGLSQDFIKNFFNAIHLESINHQKKVMNNEIYNKE